MEKEFVWKMKVEGEEHTWSCLVRDTECVTYEDGRETGRLSITEPRRMQGLLQIDTETVIFGERYPFQLENGEPYIKMDGKWKRSVTSHEERIAKLIQTHKATAWMQILLGLAACAACGIRYLVQHTMGNWFIALIIGSVIIVTGIAQLVDVRNAEKEVKNGRR